MAVTTTPAPVKEICSTYNGLVVPLLDIPNGVRLVIYLLGLAWVFLGIAIISDVFMAGIEKVTSWKKRVKDPKTGKSVTMYVWNATVANLTLMALGSSAPEILLALIEILSAQMFLGDLGAGTIVGSAAFNLLVISAVCVCAIPDGEVRYIKQTTVYIITATSSVLAYIWLWFMIQFISPNVCELWEGVLTLLFCPMLVFAAYLADKGYFDKKGTEEEVELVQAIPEDVTQEELAAIEKQIRDKNPGVELTPEQITQIMQDKYFSKRSRAYYRHAGMAKAGLGKPEPVAVAVPMPTAPPEAVANGTTVMQVTDASDGLEEELRLRSVAIGFACPRYAFLEDCGDAEVVVVRTGSEHLRASVAYKCRDGTARSPADYTPVEGVLEFGKGETSKTIKIAVIDDAEYEENEEFYVDLSAPTVLDDAKCPAKLTDIASVVVVIIDNDDPGILRVNDDELEVVEGGDPVKAEIVVNRIGGAAGTISCKYNTENMNAIASMDYEEKSGTLEFGPSVQKASIMVSVLPTGRFQKTASFIVRFTEPEGCVFDSATDGGDDCCICHVTIKGNADDGRTKAINSLSKKFSSQQAILGHRRWRKQFYDAVFTVIEEEEEEDDSAPPAKPGALDYATHCVALPWKLLFAFCPPDDYCGGWACFFGALVMIAIVTAIVGDVANLVGCCLTIQPEITAITFVALGTSLPDTFASKAAAEGDEYADASIGNVTGSNSVNVFLGLGLSWTIAAFYWELGEPSAEWLAKVDVPGGVYYDIREDIHSMRRGSHAVFVVPAGSLWFNLMVFSTNALFALQHLFARRKRFGGELGGPRKGFMGQYFSGAFLLFQWFIYIGASSVFATVNAKE